MKVLLTIKLSIFLYLAPFCGKNNNALINCKTLIFHNTAIYIVNKK